MKTALAVPLAVLIAAASLAAAPPRRPTPSDNALCRAQVRRAVARGDATGVAASCWRVGPIQLGMNEDAVERRIGRPVAIVDRPTDAATTGPQRTVRTTLHVFSVTPGTLVHHGRARLRLTELRYEDGRLVAIDTAPGARIDGYACPGRATPADAEAVEIDARTGPLLRFATVAVGDPLATLGRAFGRSPSANRSRDWYTYLPVPIGFDVDPERVRILGLSIATDARALTTAVLPTLHLQRDAACALTAIRFALP